MKFADLIVSRRRVTGAELGASVRIAPRQTAGKARDPYALSAPPAEAVETALAAGEAGRVLLRPEPSWTPKQAAPTAAQPVLRETAADPFDPATPVWPAVKPVIGNSLHAPPAEPEPAGPPEPGASPVLYAGPGWAGRLMNLRVVNREWEDLPAIVERGLGRNAAEAAAGYRHTCTAIAEGMRSRCAVLGRPDLAERVLRRTQELVDTARARAAAEAAGAR